LAEILRFRHKDAFASGIGATVESRIDNLNTEARHAEFIGTGIDECEFVWFPEVIISAAFFAAEMLVMLT